jgi:uncharacterized membrane protein YedE/YeeE
MNLLAALAAGTIFGLGLTISGMADPNNVLEFLTLNNSWSPNLILVMGSATTVTAIGYFLVKKRNGPIWAPLFSEPGASKIDLPLIAGATMFGFGWGLAGYCPGPAIVGVFQLDARALAFFTAFLIALIAYECCPIFLTRVRGNHAISDDTNR